MIFAVVAADVEKGSAGASRDDTPSNTSSNIPATSAQHPINHITPANKMQVGHTCNQGYSAPVEKIGMEVEPKVTERKH